MLQQELTKLDRSPYARIHWLDDVKAIRVEWLDLFMTLEEFKSISNHAIEILRKERGKIWIADSYNSEGVFSIEIQNFINEMVPIAKSIGITDVLTILPKSAGLASMTTINWTSRLRKKGVFVMKDFPDLESCKRWLQS